MYFKHHFASWLTLLAVIVWAAPPFALSNSEDHDSSIQALSRRVEIVNQTTVGLPGDFARSNGSALPSKRYNFTYSHDKIDVQNDTSLVAVHFGSANLSQALDAAIHNITDQPRNLSEQRLTRLNASFNHLSLFVTPAAGIMQPLSLSWSDFATILRILRSDTLQRPNYSTLFVGVVSDTNGNVYAQVAILPEIAFVSQAATTDKSIINDLNRTAPTQSIFLGNPSRTLQWEPASNEDNSDSSDHENTGDQGTDVGMEHAERFLGVTRDGPPIDGTNLEMNVRENYRDRIASDRLREAYNSLRDSVVLLLAATSDPSAPISGSAMSTVIALRRPGHGVFAEFGVMDLAYYDRSDLQLTSRELHAVVAALDVLMSRLDRIAFPPSIEIYRQGENRMIAFFYFRHQSTTDGDNNGRFWAQYALIAHPVPLRSSSAQVAPTPPRASSVSTTTGNFAIPSNQLDPSIPGSGTWESISQRLQASNQRVCSWWATCFAGSWTIP